MFTRLLVLLCVLIQGESIFAQPGDVAIYGATPSGIAAAIAAARDGCQVTLIEPYQRIGGLVTNGLSHTDFRTLEGRSGLYLEFAQRVRAHYQRQFGAYSQEVQNCFDGAFAEPKVNLLVFEQMLAEQPAIRLLTGHRLSSTTAAASQFGSLKRITSITLINDKNAEVIVKARVFIDATYEGDLMAQAGASWRAGRESRDEYGESLAPPQADDQLQAYNFRFIMTKDPTSRVTPTAPTGYRREDFVGVLAALESGQIQHVFDYPAKCIFKAQTPVLPGNKYDINDVSRNIVRLSLPGKNLKWPNGDLAARQAIFQEHVRDQVGLLFFLQNDAAVPERFRSEAREWGWCRDEFESTGYLPEQLYVREARRMIGLHVYVQRDSEHAPGDARARLHRDAIAMGDYGNNCHGTAHEGPRFGGTHTGEFYNSVPPYQIPYLALVPREVDNLLVPTAVSSSHVGFCALRLEPIWMVLGQAAGHAAAIVSAQDITVQSLPLRPLQQRLHAEGAATVYVSDVLPGQADFEAVQWWGTLGGLHGLQPMPAKPGQRGRNLHGQYYEATPDHAVELNNILDPKTATRWRALAQLAGLPGPSIPSPTAEMTRGEFIRATFSAAEKIGLTRAKGLVPREHPRAEPNTHAPGDVDNVDLVRRVVADASQLPGIVVDDLDAELVGQWQYSTHTPPYVGAGYLHDKREGKGTKSAKFTPTIKREGQYEIRLSHCTNIRRADKVRVKIHHANGEDVVVINEQKLPEHDELFTTLGRYHLTAGRDSWVEISNEGTNGKYVIVDAVQFLEVK